MLSNMTEYQFIEVEKELNELKKWTLTFNKNMNIKLKLIKWSIMIYYLLNQLLSQKKIKKKY